MLSLHEVIVPSFKRTIKVMGRLLARGESFCREQGIELEDLASTRLHPDMQPLRFQIGAALHFSMGSLDALKSGTLRPPIDLIIPDYAGLQSQISSAVAKLEASAPNEIDDHAGSSIVFEASDRRPVFTGKGLLLSFALPNLHFHATTAYDLLRVRGVRLSKKDYLGELDTETSKPSSG